MPVSQPIWQVAFPELLLLAGALLILLVDLFAKSRQWAYGLSVLLLLLLAFVCFIPLADFSGMTALSPLQRLQKPLVFTSFDLLYVTDPLASLLKLASVLATLLSLVYAQPYMQARGLWRGEVYVLALFALLGQMVMISSQNLLTVYVGLELLTLSLIALVAFDREGKQSIEAAMKYFVMGALASGFFLYGTSMVYGATGSLNLIQILQISFDPSVKTNTAFTLGLVFIVSSLAFKIGAAPFHLWIPDVYQGSRTVFTLLVGGAPKLAALALFIRILVTGLGGQTQHWASMLQFLAVASLLVGNLAAIKQTNLKRMLAYSTIAQVGFVLLGLSSVVSVSGQFSAGTLIIANMSALYYMLTYVLTTLATFGFILLLSKQGFEAEEISDLSGLYQRNPFAAMLLAIMMLSLAGLPPLVGFWAKYQVLQSMLTAGQYGLAVYAVLMSLIGAFYYLRIIKVAFFDDAKADSNLHFSGVFAPALLSVNTFALLALGLFPAGLMQWCFDVFGYLPILRILG